MINLKVIKSSNQDQIGEYQFGFNQIVFSSSQKAHIHTNFTFALEVIKEKIYLISPNEKILVNRKLSGELYSLKAGDIISFKDFSLEIVNFKFTTYLSIRETLNINTNEIIKNYPQIHETLTQIREEMKNV
jgi:hypothetical protein